MSSEAEGGQLHDRLRQLLPRAQAESCQIVATFLDIRGFSSFAATGESFDAALYLRTVYSRILADCFEDADFFKPTGDGLLLVHELPAESEGVVSIVSSVLVRALRLVHSFGAITEDDLMVNFPVPDLLGVGVARGSATRLVSDGLVLDYTGRCLNLAARLMDKARPQGVVFADVHAWRLLEPGVAEEFSNDRVYVRGVAAEPLDVCVSDGVAISPADREPPSMSSIHWGEPRTMAVEEVWEHDSYGFWLPRAPRSYEVVGVHVEHPVFTGGKRTSSVQSLRILGSPDDRPEGAVVNVPLDKVQDSLSDVPPATKMLGFTINTDVTFTPFCAPKDPPAPT